MFQNALLNLILSFPAQFNMAMLGQGIFLLQLIEYFIIGRLIILGLLFSGLGVGHHSQDELDRYLFVLRPRRLHLLRPRDGEQGVPGGLGETRLVRTPRSLQVGIFPLLNSKNQQLQPSDIFRLYSGDRGWLAVLEEREEWSCLTQYILSAWQPSYQRYAISMRYPFNMPGIYHWLFPNGSLGRQTK